ncbi:MAG: PAS domain-containing protein [Candidatus Limnocylindria bacterium]
MIPEPTSPPGGSRARVTVVNDSQDFLQLMHDLLADRYDVTLFTGEEIATEQLLASRPDILLVDMRLLPGQLSGWDIVILARAHRALRRVPVIICSADMDEIRTRQTAIDRMEGVQVLVKPFDVEILEQAIHDLLADAPIGDRQPALAVDNEQLFDGDEGVILITDRDGRYVDANVAATTFLGYTREELLTMRVTDIVADPAWARAEWDRYLRDRHWHGPMRLRRKDGRLVEATATARVLGEGEQRSFISWIRPAGVPANGQD